MVDRVDVLVEEFIEVEEAVEEILPCVEYEAGREMACKGEDMACDGMS